VDLATAESVLLSKGSAYMNRLLTVPNMVQIEVVSPMRFCSCSRAASLSLDFGHSKFLTMLKYLAYLGFSSASCGPVHCETPMPVLDHANLKLLSAPRFCAHSGLIPTVLRSIHSSATLLLHDLSRSSLRLDIFDALVVASTLPIQSVARMGSAISVLNFV